MSECTNTYLWDSSFTIIIDIELAMIVFITAYGNDLSIIKKKTLDITCLHTTYYLFKHLRGIL
ncbi:MAG: hypothetical protein QXJ97_08175, partial [Desulfurococcaceae archaeon]